ncbi:response regulator [Paenibacillus albicereus]|uniref:Response regulator n=1 Tax=Paenibacillus albicereus TaxID=2726185 RepID=A0A6H2GWJ4_9BACL|nr:response regulator [Paenibacillus albicereus]QJC51508.1 response regulator [Paenibacillus albicereus]
MLSVLIVDDEFEIREGLRRQIPWEEFGMSEVLTAGDGDEALELALDRRPDLIVTDIKMNRMSGLELLDALRSVPDYEWKAILVSGYDDFELVKQGMQLQAMDYILKPISKDELGRIARRAADTIAAERAERTSRSQLSDQMRLALPKLRDEVLRELAESGYDPYRQTRVQHRLQALKLEWMERMPLLMLLAEADDLKAVAASSRYPGEAELIRFGIGNVVSQTLAEEYPGQAVLFPDSDGRWAAVLACPDEGLAERALAVAEECLQRIRRFVKVGASLSLSSAPRDWAHLRPMYSECREYLEKKAAYGGGRVFTERSEEELEAEEPLSVREPSDAADLLRYGSDEDIHAAMEGFSAMVKSWERDGLKDIQQAVFHWLMDVYRLAAAAGWSDRSWERDPIALWEQLERYDNVQSLREHAEEALLRAARDLRRTSAQTSQIVQEAERIIRARYADGLTLQAVADEVHVTPVWLSKLFKKEKGRTFLEELTETRLARAKELLADVRFKIYQVSYSVGYKDPVHFTKLFKKQLGMTPKEYRRQRGILDD